MKTTGKTKARVPINKFLRDSLKFMKIRIIPSAILSSSLALFLAVSALAGEPSLPQLQTEAQKGDAAAQFELARIYLKGAPDLERDQTKALELMQKAAAQGHVEAIGAIGFFYANGMGVGKNEDEAVRWFRMGAEKGSAKAQLNLGNMLVRGKGVTEDSKEGMLWIQKAADQGLPEAMIVYGNALYFGDHGLTVDYEKAYPYLLKGAENGNAECQNTVGVMLQSGRGTAMDEVAAEKWLRKSAEQDNLHGQSNLGHLLGVQSKDPSRRVEALTWLYIAAVRNDALAKRTIEELVTVADPNELEQARKAAAQYAEAHPRKPAAPGLLN